MRRIVLCILGFVLVASAFSQQKSRGLSEMGKISPPATDEDKAIAKLFSGIDQSEIECAVHFSDPSGDDVLSEGEKATLRIEVKNNSLTRQMTPKLTLQLISSWDATPRSSVKWMKALGPGQTDVYVASMNWDQRLPSGSITYQVTAEDTKSGLKSSTAEVVFGIIGQGDAKVTPLFVDVDKTIPKVNVIKTDAIAVVIGNTIYSHRDIPNVDFATQDALTLKNYLINMLGFLEENIIYLENAQKAEFESVFGTQTEPQGKLYNYIKPSQSDVFVYYSGHGAPDLTSKKAYILPSNADPNYVKIYGYPVDLLCQNLDKLPCKSVTVVLDACFSGGSQQGMLIADASPMYIDVKMPVYSHRINLLTSASGDQISSWYPESNHSLFTYYFIRAIRGEADADKDRRISLKEISDYVSDNVPYMARRMYGREQTPTFKGDVGTIISAY